MSLPVGDQLELPLPGLVALNELPWGGRSPRALTRGHGFRIFEAQAEKSVSDFVRRDSGDLFEAWHKKGVPQLVRGASLLVDILARGK